ncbi:peptide-methionine (S)-S-oxide reductase MsrA [Chelativorans sp. Marseille-P2723]|uniref:peptide-methionine (S)-S-oxide reductase MsrA n=1 Tax=Chelativorans sp. Marseille-P2723 TaxID=2709133 RepID=UPI00156ECC72|nr:peptide-methionine (S)-S-oxide reductase MsrA [Chelativorans sp. Marseille-P2723]
MTRRLLFLSASQLACVLLLLHPVTAEERTAIFAGGCFWCVEADFDKVEGVLSTVSGYTGGTTQEPSYHDYEAGGHREAVEVRFDDARVTYEELLDVFFHSVDPTDDGGQFCDRGHGYTTAIYVLDEVQRQAAERAKQAAEKELARAVVTPIEPASTFWPAEDYHQDFYMSTDRVFSRFGYVTKANAYRGYREGCGRDRRLQEVWGETALRGLR